MDASALIVLTALGLFLLLISQWLKRQKTIGIAVAGEFLQTVGGVSAAVGLALLALQQFLLLF